MHGKTGWLAKEGLSCFAVGEELCKTLVHEGGEIFQTLWRVVKGGMIGFHSWQGKQAVELHLALLSKGRQQSSRNDCAGVSRRGPVLQPIRDLRVVQEPYTTFGNMM